MKIGGYVTAKRQFLIAILERPQVTWDSLNESNRSFENKEVNLNKKYFSKSSSDANFSQVSPDAFNTMMANVDTKNDNQALLAQQVLQVHFRQNLTLTIVITFKP